MCGSHFEVGISIELDEFNRRAQQRGGFFCLRGSLYRGAMGASFAARAYHKVGRTSRAGCARNHAATSEFDVIGVGAKSQQRRMFRGRVRCRLHQSGRWGRELEK